MGRCTYPKYFKFSFTFKRAKYITQAPPVDSVKVERLAQVIELRSQGWSFPAIAKDCGRNL